MSLNVTIDDFDPLIAYGDYAAWSTPDPSQNPTFWNVSTEVSGVPWHQATYHLAKAGATAYLNFTGPSVWIYGSTGSSSNYTIGIDPDLPQPFSQDYTTSIPSDIRGLLYSSDQLTDSAHRLQITNNAGDDGLRLDLVVIGQQLGAEGATLTNTTVQDNSPDITYSGSWTEQSGPNFSGGTSHYTQGPGNAFEYSFTGSAIYIYGDQVNDHGPYSIYLNGSTTPYATYTGRSGCGSSTYEKTCEKLHGLIGFVGGLPEGRHTIKLENQGPAEGDRTYVDFDYLEYTTPSQYRMLNSVQSHQCPFVTCDSVAGPSGSGAAPSGTASAGTGVSGSSGSTPSPSGSGAAGAPSPTGAAAGGPDVGSGLLGLVLGLWVLKRVWQF